MRIGINYSNTTMLESVDPVPESAARCDTDRLTTEESK